MVSLVGLREVLVSLLELCIGISILIVICLRVEDFSIVVLQLHGKVIANELEAFASPILGLRLS